jgi:beta-glucanase (GH16 family)
MKSGRRLIAVAAAMATSNAADVAVAGGTDGYAMGAAPVGAGSERLGWNSDDASEIALATDLGLWHGAGTAPPQGVPAPSRRTFHPVRWKGRAAVFRLRGVRPSSVRRAYAVAGPYRKRVGLARVRRATRHGMLRIRFPAAVPRHDATVVLVTRPVWTLAFRDEFSGFVLNPRVWHTCFWWATTTCSIQSNDELALYRPENVEVADGLLRLRAEHSGAIAWHGRTYRYASGMVMTGGRLDQKPPGFTYTYGYAEARVRVPSGRGLWPAFWMLPASYRSRPEIDAMEILGHAPNVQNMNLHYLTRWGGHGDAGAIWAGPDFSTGWHTFGVDWQPKGIVWYVDGVERWRFSDASVIPREPMYLLLNLAVGGPWAGAPDASKTFPSYLRVDYVRVWQ